MVIRKVRVCPNLHLDGELLLGASGNVGSFSTIYDEEEHTHRPALEFLIKRPADKGIKIPSVSYLRAHFDPRWPRISEWIDEVTPAYNRLMNSLIGIFDPCAIFFGGQVPPPLVDLLIDRTHIFARPRDGMPRPYRKLIVSEIAGDASAIGAAVTPFRATFY